MFKSKLQELCHQKKWMLPEYTTSKAGADHIPIFQATCTVNGVPYQSQEICRSAKEAHNEAARQAYYHLSASPVNDLSTGVNIINNSIANGGAVLQESREANPNPRLFDSTLVVKDEMAYEGLHSLYKHQLQIIAQKKNLGLPMFSIKREGLPHAPRFKCKVSIGVQSFESPDFFATIREAENAVAKVALVALSRHGEQEATMDLSYKNLLQELTQKAGSPMPLYTTHVSGESHVPRFISNVEAGGQNFSGQESKTKKQAELSAAKVAYINLKNRNSNQSLTSLPMTGQIQEARENSSNITNVDDPQLAFGPKENMLHNSSLTSKQQVGNGGNSNQSLTSLVMTGQIQEAHENSSNLTNVDDPQLAFGPEENMLHNSSLTSKQQAESGEPFLKDEVENVPHAKILDSISTPSTFVPSSSSDNLVIGSHGVQLPVGTNSITESWLPTDTTAISPSETSTEPLKKYPLREISGPCKRIVVYPHGTNLEIPSHTVLPSYDDKWTAVQLDTQSCPSTQ